MTSPVTIEKLADWLLKQDDILVLGHVSPDGDAAGSTMAVCRALKDLGKRAAVCLPGGLPRMYGWLPGSEDVIAAGDALPFEPKAAFSVDVSEPERLGEDGLRLFESCPNRAMIDHHATNPGFGEIYFVDGEAAACGELMIDLLDAMNAPLTKDIATCLFVAVSTDCGNFNFSNTRLRTFEAGGRCVAAGVDIARVTERLYRVRSLGRTRLMGGVLNSLQISGDGRIAWSAVTERMFEEAGALREDNTDIVNYLLEIDGVLCAVLAEQRGEATKFSLRSKEPLDVARDVAMPFGGGGHACAAGCTVNASVEEAMPRVLAQARRAVDEIMRNEK